MAPAKAGESRQRRAAGRRTARTQRNTRKTRVRQRISAERVQSGRKSVDLTFRVYRVWTERFEDEAGRQFLHAQRAKLLHGLVDALGMEVRDWGETDSDYPREVVEVAIALAPVVIPALASVINTWIKASRIKRITIKRTDGSEIDITGVSSKQLKAIVEAIE